MLTPRRWLAAGVLALTACTSSGGSPTADTSPPAPASAAPTVTPTSAAASEPSAIAGLGLPPLELSVVDEDLPALTWPGVADAETYLVVVTGPTGDAVWSWAGDATRVTVGGAHAGTSAAQPIPDGARATVVALEVGGAPLAASGTVPLSSPE